MHVLFANEVFIHLTIKYPSSSYCRSLMGLLFFWSTFSIVLSVYHHREEHHAFHNLWTTPSKTIQPSTSQWEHEVCRKSNGRPAMFANEPPPPHPQIEHNKMM